MSTLILDELFPGVVFEQEFRINRDMNVRHLRLWVYLHGTLADGELQVEVLQGATVLKTQTLTAAEINAVKTETFAHGYLRFNFDSLQLRVAEGNTEETYKMRVQMINHTLDSGNFLGAVRIWDDKIYPTYGSGVINGQAPNDFVEPLGFELFEYRSI